jgi:methylase of polypeptide subunit release factors
MLFEASEPLLEASLAGLARSLGAADIEGLSASEEQLLARAREVGATKLREACKAIGKGADVLGDAFCTIRSSERRRGDGATYTPGPIIRAMLAWASAHGKPSTIVDPGTGSGRFLLAAARRFPSARLIGIENDPLAALLARANLAQAGLSDRARVILSDYRSASLDDAMPDGPTLYIGNPPYVRHHLISREWKDWLSREGDSLALDSSTLAGLHVHFFVATAKRLRPGDYGCFITSAEWLDVNYGRMVRQLFLSRLGGTRLVVIEPKAMPFPDAATTGAITCFSADAKPRSVYVQRVAKVGDLKSLNGKRRVRRERFESEARWSHLTRRSRPVLEGFVELGELCRVHRGQVTGANSVWIVDTSQFELPESVLFRTVTRARELFSAGLELADARSLRQVVDLPIDLDELRQSHSRTDWNRIQKFIKYAKSRGANTGYVAESRARWWSVGLREPAPILATYMARRPPAFVQNKGEARHLNIAHGLYPREPLSDSLLRRLVKYLSRAVQVTAGRTYAGGLTKFEPREMERIPVPEPNLLRSAAFA